MTGDWKRKLPIVLLGAVATIAIVAVIWVFYTFGTDLRDLAGEIRAFALEFLGGIHPGLYFIAFALTPALGVPITFFYLTAGTVFGYAVGGIVWSVLLAWLAMATNIAFGYWLASSFMNPVISKLLRARGHEIPKASPKTEGKVILVVRLSPLPFALQNWSLGAARFQFLRYMIYSWPIQIGLGTGVILVGDALFQGGAGIAIIGIFMICLFTLLAHLARTHFRQPNE